MLLQAAMQLALDPPPVGIGRPNEPPARRAQLLDLGSQRVERVLEPFALAGFRQVALQSSSEKFSVIAAAASSA